MYEADRERIGHMICELSDKRVLDRDGIKRATGYDNEGSLDKFLRWCLDNEIIVEVGDAYTLYPHVSGLFGPFYGKRIAKNRDVKERVAEYVVQTMDFVCGASAYVGLAGLLQSGQAHSLMLDAGTSTQAVVRCLKERVLDSGATREARPQVYSVNLHSAMTLAASPVELRIPQGRIDPRFAALVGDEAAADVRASFPKSGTALLAASAINARDGLTTEDDAEIPVKREIVAKLPDVTLIVVTDHSKVGPIGNSLFADLPQTHKDLRDRFEKHAYVVIDELPPGTKGPLKKHYREALAYLIKHFHSPDPNENRLKMIDTIGTEIAAPDIPARVKTCTK